MTTKSKLGIGCAAVLAVGLTALIGTVFWLHRTYSPLLAGANVPDELKDPRVVVAAPFLKGSSFLRAGELGEIKSMSNRVLEDGRGSELIIVGQTGALVADLNGNRKSSVTFSEKLERHWGIQTHEGNLRFGEIQLLQTFDTSKNPVTRFLVRNSLGTAELIDVDGRSIWTDKDCPVPRGAVLEDVTGGDVHQDGKFWYAASYLGGKGLVLLDEFLNEKWERPEVNAKHVEFIDTDGSGHLKIVHDDFNRIVVRNIDGELISQGDTGHYIGYFSILNWPTNQDRPYILDFENGTICLSDFDGHAVAQYQAPLSKALSKVHGITVSLTTKEPDYFAALVEDRVIERSILYVYNSARDLIYQEILPGHFGSIAAVTMGNTDRQAILVGGHGTVLLYQIQSGTGRIR